MNWFDRLMGRSGEAQVQIDDEGLVIPRPESPVARGDGTLPSFRNPAGRIGRKFGRSGAQDARALIRDAFIPSQPVNDRGMFAGRRGLLEDLIVALEDQRLHFILFGDRGIGKTSIMNVLGDLATDAEYLVCYISCGERMTFSDFARRIAQRIPLLYHSEYLPGSLETEEGKTMADLLAQQGEIDVSTFSDLLARVSDTRLIMLLDEFDRVETDDFRRSIAELIKNLSDKAAPAQIVIAGVAADVAELIAQIPSIRRNVLGVLVPNMTDEEVGEMLDIAERSTRLNFAPDARELIGLASLGLPYLVGLVAQHAALIATTRDDLDVSKADVREAIRKSRSELSGRIAAPTLHAISTAVERDQLIEYGKLAHAALRAGGVIRPELISDELGAGDDEGGTSPLIERIENDPLKRWHFVDDGASVFIWLSALSAE